MEASPSPSKIARMAINGGLSFPGAQNRGSRMGHSTGLRPREDDCTAHARLKHLARAWVLELRDACAPARHAASRAIPSKTRHRQRRLGHLAQWLNGRISGKGRSIAATSVGTNHAIVRDATPDARFYGDVGELH